MTNWHDTVVFGIHHDLHAEARDTELGQELTPEHLREQLAKVRPDWVQCDCKGVYGYTSWPTTVGDPSPGIVGDALRVYRDVTKELGIPLAVHFCGLWDEAAVFRHPDWARVDGDGRSDPKRICPRSAYERDRAIPLMLEVIDRYDVDGFWIDGDVWWATPCYCSRCRAAFGDDPPRSRDEPGWRRWQAFGRTTYEEYARAFIDAVHSHKPGCLVCVNWLYSSIQPDRVELTVDWLSGDFSDLDLVPGVEQTAWEARVYAARGLTWDLMPWLFLSGEEVSWDSDFVAWQTKTIAHLARETAEIIANGGAVSVYVVPERSGRLVASEHDLVAELAGFCRARTSVNRATASVPQAAILHLGPSVYERTEDTLYGRPRSQPDIAAQGALFALLDSGFHADVLCEDGLPERIHDFPLVVVPEQVAIPEDLAAALTTYVERGGHLVLSGADIAANETLASLAGVESASGAAQTTAFLPHGGGNVTVQGRWRPVRPAAASVMVPFRTSRSADGASGDAAVTARELGDGRLVAIHGDAFAAYYRTRYPQLRDLLGELVRAAWPAPRAELESESHVVLNLREQAGRTIVHLLNRGADPAPTVHNQVIERVPRANPVTVRVRRDDRPESVSLVPPNGADLRRWSWSDGVLTASVENLGVHAALVIE